MAKEKIVVGLGADVGTHLLLYGKLPTGLKVVRVGGMPTIAIDNRDNGYSFAMEPGAPVGRPLILNNELKS